jgi:predicted DNA-binding transcriptional regulator AlpA
MQETPMLFPVSPTEFWKQIKTIMEEVVEQKLNASSRRELSPSHIPEKALLKATEVCAIFQVSKPTLYEWMKQDKLKSFKIKSRRYFSRVDIEAVIKQTNVVNQ